MTAVRRLRAACWSQSPHVCATRRMVCTNVRSRSSLQIDRVNANIGVLYFSIAVARKTDGRRGMPALRLWDPRIVRVEMKA